MYNFIGIGAAISFITSFFVKEYRSALRWTAGILAAIFGYKKVVEPSIETVTNALDLASAGTPPAGYTYQDALVDRDIICAKLSLHTNYLDGYMTNDDEPEALEVLENNTGEQNRYLEKVWLITRGVPLQTEMGGELSTEEKIIMRKHLSKLP